MNWVDAWGLSATDKKSTSKQNSFINSFFNPKGIYGPRAPAKGYAPDRSGVLGNHELISSVSIAVEVATNPAVQHEIGEAVAEVKQTVSEIGTTITSTVKGIWDGIFNAGSHKGAPDSLGRIERDASGGRKDRHAHSKKKGDWDVNEDGTAHDGNHNPIPKDVADFLRRRGFKIPDDRKPR